MKYLEYKGYTGSIEYSSEDNILYGQILGIRGLILYEGITGGDLEKDFHEVVNEYISMCKEEGRTPEKPFKGSFNVRIPSKLHRKAALLARETRMSLNSFVAESIRLKIAHESD